MEKYIGKKAYKKTGFYSGLIGIIEKSTNTITPYQITFYDSEGTNRGAVAFSDLDDIELVEVKKMTKFKIGDKVTHFMFGDGVILGNYHKRQDGYYYWHISYSNGTFGYNREASLSIRKTFADLLREKAVTLNDIDDYIEAWHNNKVDLPIYEFLGLTKEQYGLWVECKVTKETDFYSKDEIEAMKNSKEDNLGEWNVDNNEDEKS